MEESNAPVTPEAPKKPARVWSTRGRIMGVPVSLIAIWAALFVAASAIPALPVPGMSGMITVNAILTGISGMILGPAAAIANAAGSIIAMILFPFGFSLGPLGFITATAGGLVSGLLFTNRWKLAGLAELAVLAAWFCNPRSWQPLMWMIPLPYAAIAVLVIFVKPLRDWARKKILTLDKVWMWPAVFLIVAASHSAEYLTTNSMVNWMFNLTWQYWVPTLPYWIGVDSIIIVLATVVGVGVMTGLRRAHLPQIADTLEK